MSALPLPAEIQQVHLRRFPAGDVVGVTVYGHLDGVMPGLINHIVQFRPGRYQQADIGMADVMEPDFPEPGFCRNPVEDIASTHPETAPPQRQSQDNPRQHQHDDQLLPAEPRHFRLQGAWGRHHHRFSSDNPFKCAISRT